MSYENAPATKMLATHCTACGRPLLDADSVTAGLGPVCRKHARSIPPEVREQANRLIYACARADVTTDELTACVVELSLLGCNKIADRIAKRGARVVVTLGESVDVKAPYDDEFLRNRKSGRWIGKERVTRYARGAASQAAHAIGAAFGRNAVRLEDGESWRFVTVAELTDLLAAVEAEAPAVAPPAAPEPPKWSGTPARLRSGGWGVKFVPEGGACPVAGDRVRVTARSGKVWIATLGAFVSHTRYGDVWSTN